MNATHFHLLLNHFPIIGTLLGSSILLWGIIQKQNNLKTTAAVLLVVMSLIAIPVYLTGEPAEEAVEKLPGVSESMKELHEEAANYAIWMMSVTGAVSLLALFLVRQKNKTADTVFLFNFILSVICFATMAVTGYYGGKIRHSEIRETTINAVPGSNEQNVKGQNEKDDDD